MGNWSFTVEKLNLNKKGKGQNWKTRQEEAMAENSESVGTGREGDNEVEREDERANHKQKGPALDAVSDSNSSKDKGDKEIGGSSKGHSMEIEEGLTVPVQFGTPKVSSHKGESLRIILAARDMNIEESAKSEKAVKRKRGKAGKENVLMITEGGETTEGREQDEREPTKKKTKAEVNEPINRNITAIAASVAVPPCRAQ